MADKRKYGGFFLLASKYPDRQRAIAAKGGRKAHESGKAHQWTNEEAKIAGKKGGKIRKLKSIR